MIDKKDAHHNDALKIDDFLNDLNETTVINTTVLVETLNWSVGIDNLNEIYSNLHAENQVIQLTDSDYSKSLEINGWYGNSINYSDCTIIHTMLNMGIRKIVSFDSGFKKIQGFDVIPKI